MTYSLKLLDTFSHVWMHVLKTIYGSYEFGINGLDIISKQFLNNNMKVD